MILQRNLLEREKTKDKMYKVREDRDKVTQDSREKMTKKWLAKTIHSPFAVDLVAEDERTHEENTIRLREEMARQREIQNRREKAKSDIILKALSEFSDLEALRQEKKAILEEEQRLKALLALEKTAVHGKADRLAAERAMKQRKYAKAEVRRSAYEDSLDEVIREEDVALRNKHGVALKGSTTNFKVEGANARTPLGKPGTSSFYFEARP